MTERPALADAPPTADAPVPDGYPLPAWAEPPSEWGVSAELRPYYAAAAAGGVGDLTVYERGPIPHRQRFEVSGPRRDGGRTVSDPVPYAEWAHRLRFDAATQSLRATVAAAEFERTQVTACESCGARAVRSELRAVVVRDRAAGVCATCYPGVEAAARGLDLLADGRTRAEAQAALIRRLIDPVGDRGDLPVDVADRVGVPA